MKEHPSEVGSEGKEELVVNACKSAWLEMLS
jgi:hypothetical protein